jgi:hypothetical protein
LVQLKNLVHPIKTDLLILDVTPEIKARFVLFKEGKCMQLGALQAAKPGIA